MVTARCTRFATGATENTDNSDFGFDDRNSDDENGVMTPTATGNATCCCLACCYASSSAFTSTDTARNRAKTTAVAASSADSDYEYDAPSSEAAAFVASATAAAFVLLAALLAVVLSSAALLTLASMVPVADAAADVDHNRSPSDMDYLNRWYQQQQQQPQEQPQLYPSNTRYQLRQRRQSEQQQQQQQQQQRVSRRQAKSDTPRRRRQLFKNREPGIISLAFSLVGGTVSDVRQAYKNASTIVQQTIFESAKNPQTTTVAPEGEQPVSVENPAENEIGGAEASSSTTTAVTPVDTKKVNQALGKLVGRNYRGLRKLFDSEFRTAVRNSPGNIRDFTVDLVGSIGQSLRPASLFSRGPVNGETTTAVSK